VTDVQTATGVVDSAALGRTLMHEHVFVLTPDVQANHDEWDEEAAVADAVGKLSELAAAGYDTIVDPTVIGLGRYVPRIVRVAEQVDLSIIVATGVYTYDTVPFYFQHRGPALLPDLPDPMIDMFIRDLTIGIPGTNGVRAAFLKSAIDHFGMTRDVERILRATARAHRATGAPITLHTHPGSKTGLDAHRVLAEEGVDPSRVVLGHSGDTDDIDHLVELADLGYLLGMDRFGVDTIAPVEQRVRTVVEMVNRGYVDRMVLSQDASCYFDWLDPAFAGALPNWHYLHIENDVLPALRKDGVTDEQIDQIAHREPAPVLRERRGVLMPIEPFDLTGVYRDDAGIKHYADLPASVVAMLRESVDAAPDAEAIVELDGPRVTYTELWDRAARVAGGLRESGVGRGDRVAIRYGNGLDWVLAFLGTLMAGGVAVPVNTRFTETEVEYVVTDSGAAVVLGPDGALPDGAPYADEGLTLGDLGAIFYTSGTTGFPKGAMVTHENFVANSENSLRLRGIRDASEQNRNLVSVPLFHVTGCIAQMLPTLMDRGCTVVMPVFDVQRFLRAINEERIKVVTTVPAIFWYALSQPNVDDVDLSGVEHATYGGAPIAPSLVGTIKKAFGNARVGNGFGLSETSGVSTFLPHEYADTHADSVGFAIPTVDLRIDEPDPSTGVGEILIRGSNVVAGYWNKPEATAATFVDGWLHTGDLGRIDEDGFTYVVDRAKDMINRGGENVYCVEVENALAAAPGVFEVAVIGVPDEMMGEKVGAVLVPTPGGSVDVDEVLMFARHRLADYKVPQYVWVRPEALPRNPGGKVLKPVLRDNAAWHPVG
jgi:long-chain acyl-CoA synthetase